MMEAGDDTVIIGGFEFVRMVYGGYIWWSPCFGRVIDADSDQPLIDAQFHMMTCESEKCREAAA